MIALKSILAVGISTLFINAVYSQLPTVNEFSNDSTVYSKQESSKTQQIFGLGRTTVTTRRDSSGRSNRQDSAFAEKVEIGRQIKNVSNSVGIITLGVNANSSPQFNKLLKIHIAKVPELHLGLLETEQTPFLRNKRNVYSSLWAFASLNYLYADLVGVMDKNKLRQYQAGVVDGVSITPQFLTVAAGFMQIPLMNVFLPHLIKNEKTLRWVQIISGTVMSVVQSGTLFVGKPTPYYALFSATEIAATAYITIDAIKWKPKSKKRM